MMSFRVVIPSLNQGRFIGAAIRSVLRESEGVEVELVVVDACSTDQTRQEVERAIATDHRAHVTLIREPDDGQSDAINKGMQGATSDVVSWLNADDALVGGALRRVERAFAEGPSDSVVVYGGVRYIDELGRTLSSVPARPWTYGDLLWGPGYIAQPAAFMRRSAWEAVGGVRRELRYSMDFDLWLRLAELGPFVHVPDVLAEFRLHSSSKTVSSSRAMRAEGARVRRLYAERYLGRAPKPLEIELRGVGVRVRRRLGMAARGRAG